MNLPFHKLLRELPPQFFTLKLRLKVFITVLLLVVVGGPLYFLVYQLEKQHDEFTENMIETTTHAVYQSIFDAMLENDTLEIQHNLEQYSRKPNIELVRIFRPTGDILYSTRREELKKNIYDLQNSEFLDRKSTGLQESFLKQGNSYSHHHPLYVQEECLPCHTNQGETIAIMDVHVGFTDSEYLYSSIKQWMIFSAIFIVAMLWISLNFLYENQIETRLRKIIGGFQELARGNLRTQVSIPGRHELAMLAQKFNQTVEKLRQAKEKEDQFMQENLARADRLVTLGEVATEIAHEVNNPASIILTRAEILMDELNFENGGVKCGEDLEIIIQQTEKIAEITRSILHYARKLPHSFSETDLHQVVERSLNILSPRLKKARAEVELHPLPTPALVKGNFNQLEQVFCNLINNSLDVLPPEGGKIHIDLEEEQLPSGQSAYRVRFSDNGPGVPEEFREEIFSPFFTTKGDGKGTGLGLFIVRNIIANHKGKIFLSDSSDNGAAFIIELEAFNGKG